MNMRLRLSGSIGGVSINSTINREAEGAIAQTPELPAASAGTLSTRTSDTAGVVTLSANHGIEVGNLIDIYFGTQLAFDALVTGVSGNNVTFEAAAGDDLPAEDDDIIAAKTVMIDTDFQPGYLQGLYMECTAPARVGVYSEAGHKTSFRLTANECNTWWKVGNQIPPLAALMPGETVDFIRVSQAGTAKVATLDFAALYDSIISPSSSSSGE